MMLCRPTEKIQRNSNVELLRIIAMLFIVLSHICVHSNFQPNSMSFSFNKLFIQFVSLGDLGTDIFVIISGYFLCTSVFKPKNIIRLLNQVYFYSILSFLIFSFAFNYNYGLRGYFMVFFPTIFKEYWFFSAYFIVFLLSPFINKFLTTLDEKAYRIFLLITIILWVVIPTFTTQTMFASELIQFLLLYSIGAYLNLYPENFLQKFKVRFTVTFISFSLLFLSTIVFNLLATKFSIFADKGHYFYSRNSLLTILSAIGLCSIAIYSKPKYNKFTNLIGGCTFGVYLIHENPAFRDVIWKDLLNLPQFSQSLLLPLIIIGTALVVFILCSLIELIRQKTIAKPMLTLSNKIACSIGAFFRRLIKK